MATRFSGGNIPNAIESFREEHTCNQWWEWCGLNKPTVYDAEAYA